MLTSQLSVICDIGVLLFMDFIVNFVPEQLLEYNHRENLNSETFDV